MSEVTHLIGKLKFVGIMRRYMSFVTHTHVIHVIHTHMSHAPTYAWVLPHINVWVMWPINIWLMWPLSLTHSSSLLSHTEIYKSCYTRYVSHVTHAITIRCIQVRHTYMYASSHTCTPRCMRQVTHACSGLVTNRRMSHWIDIWVSDLSLFKTKFVGITHSAISHVTRARLSHVTRTCMSHVTHTQMGHVTGRHMSEGFEAQRCLLPWSQRLSVIGASTRDLRLNDAYPVGRHLTVKYKSCYTYKHESCHT